MDKRQSKLARAALVKQALAIRMKKRRHFIKLVDALVEKDQIWHTHYQDVVDLMKGSYSNSAIRGKIVHEDDPALLAAWDERQRRLSSGACAALVEAAESEDLDRVQPLVAPAIQSYLELTQNWNQALNKFMHDTTRELEQLTAIGEPLTTFTNMFEPYYQRTRQYWYKSFEGSTDGRGTPMLYNKGAKWSASLWKEDLVPSTARAVQLQRVSDTLTWTLTSKTELGGIDLDKFDSGMQQAYCAAVHAAVREEELRSAVLRLRKASGEAPTFAPGDDVWISGLQIATQLNFTKGTVTSGLAQDTGRYQVLCELDDTKRMLKPINLVSTAVDDTVDSRDSGEITLTAITATGSVIKMNTVIRVSNALRLPAARMARVENEDIVRELKKKLPGFSGTITMAPYESTRVFIDGDDKDLDPPTLLVEDPMTLQQVQDNTIALQDNLKHAIIFYMATEILNDSNNARADMVEALATLGLQPGASIPEVIKAYDILRIPYQAKMGARAIDANRELTALVARASDARKGSGDLAEVVTSVGAENFESFKRQLEYTTIHTSLRKILSQDWQHQQAAMASLGFPREYKRGDHEINTDAARRYKIVLVRRSQDRTNDILDQSWIIGTLMKAIGFEKAGTQLLLF